MIDLDNKSRLTKVSRVFPWSYTYTSRVAKDAAMKQSFSKFIPIIAAAALEMAVAPVVHAQIGSITHIIPVPDGVYFTVDGQSYNHAASAVWPAGSKHILSVDTAVQDSPIDKSRYSFKGWRFPGGTLPTNPVAVTADSSISEYRAVFDVQYALSIVFFNCPDPAHCDSPGSIYAGGAPITSSTDIYMGAGAVATLQAVPNPGYVFLGWQPGRGQVITGFQNMVTVNGPTSVYPRFTVAGKINLLTVPTGLQVLADRIQVPTPNTMDW